MGLSFTLRNNNCAHDGQTTIGGGGQYSESPCPHGYERVGVFCPVYGSMQLKDPLPLLEKSEVVILVGGFLFPFHRLCHRFSKSISQSPRSVPLRRVGP